MMKSSLVIALLTVVIVSVSCGLASYKDYGRHASYGNYGSYGSYGGGYGGNMGYGPNGWLPGYLNRPYVPPYYQWGYYPPPLLMVPVSPFYDMSCCQNSANSNCCSQFFGRCLCITMPTGCTVTTTTPTPAPTTTTTLTTTTTPTTTTTTTTTPLTLCPLTPRSRVLNGQPVSSCTEFPGVVYFPVGNGTICHGVVLNANTLVVHTNCEGALTVGTDVLAGPDGTVVGTIPSGEIPFSFNTGGASTITLTTPLNTDACPSYPCIYTPDMMNYINTQSCYFVGAGGRDATGLNSEPLSSGRLTFQPTVNCAAYISGVSQQFFLGANVEYGCFNPVTSLPCQGDQGGSVFCDTTTGERVLMGMMETAGCLVNESVAFYPLPGQELFQYPVPLP